MMNRDSVDVYQLQRNLAEANARISDLERAQLATKRSNKETFLNLVQMFLGTLQGLGEAVLRPWACVVWFFLAAGKDFWTALSNWIVTMDAASFLKIVFSPSGVGILLVAVLGPTALRAFVSRVQLMLPYIVGEGPRSDPLPPTNTSGTPGGKVE